MLWGANTTLRPPIESKKTKKTKKNMPRDQGGSRDLAERIFFTYLELRSCLGSLIGEKSSFSSKNILNPKR